MIKVENGEVCKEYAKFSVYYLFYSYKNNFFLLIITLKN